MSEPVKPKKKVIINPLGELDIVTDNNFSYESVPEGKKLTIPSNHQMIVHEGFIVDGDLDLKGTLVLEE